MPDLDQAFLLAAKEGDLARVQEALAAGTDVHMLNDFALRGAAENGHLDVVTCLLRAGANPKAQGNNALRQAAARGFLEIVRALLAAGADVHAENGLALQWAARGGHLPVVECLLAAGANVHAGGGAALRLAAANGHADVVRMLFAHGAQLAELVPETHEYPSGMQVVLVSCCNDPGELSAIKMAKDGACLEAIYVLLKRQGHEQLLALIRSTQMLDTLTPDARADLLEDLLANHLQPERPFVTRN